MPTQMPHMRKYLRHMEPLPKLPKLKDAQVMLDRLHEGVSLAEELAHFVGRAAALPAVLRSRALASMETGMRQRCHELLAPDRYAPVQLESILQQKLEQSLLHISVAFHSHVQAAVMSSPIDFQFLGFPSLE